MFLSYASQDAEAAKRICDALRAAGIEVWFDQSELRGGDAWDQMIRKQIKACALFIPVISGHTHERSEGYFRLEWKLAVDRSHLIMANKAFLLPVVIDDTGDDDENVPDKFREVQWTRLPDGDTPPAFVERVQRLLSGETSTTTQVHAASGAVPAIGGRAPPSGWSRRVLPAAAIAALAVAALLVGGYALWRVRSAGVTSVRLETPAATLPARTVAVLPFENLSAEPNDGFLATGIAESVLHRLAAVKSLSVIARTSSFTFRGREVDARDIGHKLNARYLVEGSVQRAGDRLRVIAQLLDASSGSDLWSLRFDRSMGDIFEVEDEISGKVADALAVSLEVRPGSGSARTTPKLDAYLAYIEGRSLLSTSKIADAKAGIERLRRATEIDPTFAAAYAQEAHGLRLLPWLLDPDGPDEAEANKQAAALVDKALSLDPELGEAWVERADARQSDAFDASTDADFRKGLALAPNYAQGYQLYAEWLDRIGRTDDALVTIERARQLDPLAPRNHYKKGLMLLDRDDVDAAEALFLEALRVNPTYHPALARLGQLEMRRGNLAQAVKLVERAIAIDPGANWMRPHAAFRYLELNDAAAAQDVLSTLSPTALSTVLVRSCIAIYQREARRAAAELYALPHAEFNKALLSDNECPAVVIRDDALDRHDYGRGLRALEVCLAPEWHSVLSHADGSVRISCALRYASLLMASGERDRAARLVQAMLKAMEGHQADGDVAGLRSVALMLLGDTDGALKALEAAFAAQKFGWSYEFERAPEFEALHAQPRFQSLVRQYQDIVAKQSALLAGMRRAGEVPYRPPQSAEVPRT